MDRSIILWLLGALLATAVSARAQLQLTPSLQELEGDGGKFKQLAFSDGDKIVTYQAPMGWDYSGSATRLVLHPPGVPQAEATITKLPLAQPGVFDDDTLKKLVDEAMTLVPKGSENVTVVSQEKNPMMIDRKETFLLTLSYTFYGLKYDRSILFLNRGNEQIRFQLTCRDADFKKVHRAFLASQYTWQGL